MKVQVAVVGAGIAGLAAAQTLHRSGVAVQVFDKGRGPGGRTSTRRSASGDFDHGAQYFTARSEDFRAATNAWLAAGVISRWSPRLGDATTPRATPRDRFVPQPAMNGLARHLAQGLALTSAVQIAQARRQADGWTLHTAAGEVCRAAALIIAVPAPQVSPLVAGLAADMVAALARVTFAPCWAVMANANSGHGHPQLDAAFVSDGPLGWVARQGSRPGRRGAGWVLHATAAFSEAHLEADPAQVRGIMVNDFQKRFGIKLAPDAVAHRWRFARVTQPAGSQPCLVDADSGLVLAGDWCTGERIEDAYRSGVAAGQAVGLALASA